MEISNIIVLYNKQRSIVNDLVEIGAILSNNHPDLEPITLRLNTQIQSQNAQIDAIVRRAFSGPMVSPETTAVISGLVQGMVDLSKDYVKLLTSPTILKVISRGEKSLIINLHINNTSSILISLSKYKKPPKVKMSLGRDFTNSMRIAASQEASKAGAAIVHGTVSGVKQLVLREVNKLLGKVTQRDTEIKKGMRSSGFNTANYTQWKTSPSQYGFKPDIELPRLFDDDDRE